MASIWFYCVNRSFSFINFVNIAHKKVYIFILKILANKTQTKDPQKEKKNTIKTFTKKEHFSLFTWLYKTFLSPLTSCFIFLTEKCHLKSTRASFSSCCRSRPAWLREISGLCVWPFVPLFLCGYCEQRELPLAHAGFLWQSVSKSISVHKPHIKTLERWLRSKNHDSLTSGHIHNATKQWWS